MICMLVNFDISVSLHKLRIYRIGQKCGVTPIKFCVCVVQRVQYYMRFIIFAYYFLYVPASISPVIVR